MFRLPLFVFCLFLGSVTVFGQLPNRSGQIWREYPAALPPGDSKVYAVQAIKNGAAKLEENTASPCIVEYIRRQTGEAAWIGENFGLISYDGQKLYVYHAPAMQQQVAEIVARFMRPETRNVEFVTEFRWITTLERDARKKGNSDIRLSVLQYLHPLVTPDNNPVCQTPGVAAYWIAKDNIPLLCRELGIEVGGYREYNPRHPNLIGNKRTPSEFTTLNGQCGGIRNSVKHHFHTDRILVQTEPETVYKGIFTVYDEGTMIQSLSLLSWDRRTVTTDLSYLFSQIESVRIENVGPGFENGRLQLPQLRKYEFSEHGLAWPADGMLVVFFGSNERQQEVETETGTPLLNKIPLINRTFKNTAVSRENAAVNFVLFVWMAEAAPSSPIRHGGII